MPVGNLPFPFLPHSIYDKTSNSSFIQQIFIEYLLCPGCFARSTSCKDKLDTVLALKELTIWWGRPILGSKRDTYKVPHFFLKWGHLEKERSWLHWVDHLRSIFSPWEQPQDVRHTRRTAAYYILKWWKWRLCFLQTRSSDSHWEGEPSSFSPGLCYWAYCSIEF